MLSVINRIKTCTWTFKKKYKSSQKFSSTLQAIYNLIARCSTEFIIIKIIIPIQYYWQPLFFLQSLNIETSYLKQDNYKFASSFWTSPI